MSNSSTQSTRKNARSSRCSVRRGNLVCALPLVRSVNVACLVLACLGGCDTEPIKDERPNQILSACCEAARSRIEVGSEVETSNFRDRCNACKVGKGKNECEGGAKRVQIAVRKAYPDGLLPTECSTLSSQLKQLGISIPSE